MILRRHLNPEVAKSVLSATLATTHGVIAVFVPAVFADLHGVGEHLTCGIVGVNSADASVHLSLLSIQAHLSYWRSAAQAISCGAAKELRLWSAGAERSADPVLT